MYKVATNYKLPTHSASAAQIGPNAQATAVFLNKRLGLSHQKISRCFDEVFGISLTPGGVAQIVLRTGRRSGPVYQQIAKAIHNSSQVTADETGWRINGRKAWVHVLTCQAATLYGVENKRDASFAQAVLGANYDGVMVHDGNPIYDQFRDALHQQCLSHLMRRCHDLLAASNGHACSFPQDVLCLFETALELRERYEVGEISEGGLWIMHGRLSNQLEELAMQPKRNDEQARLSRHLLHHLEEWFLFLGFPQIDATNYRGEQALRYIVVNRKVWGGNRTPSGARAQAVLSSVLVTCEQQNRPPIDYTSRLLCQIRPPPLIPAGVLKCNGPTI